MQIKQMGLFGQHISDFIEGRHELLHLYFILVDIIQDTFSDPNNLEEASSLARMIQSLNPKLLNKRGKENFNAFKSVYKDIFLAIISEFLRDFLNVESLTRDSTPENIKNMKSDIEQQQAFVNLIRSFIIKTHPDFKNCSEIADNKSDLPPYYPHQDFLRQKYRVSKTGNVKNVQKNPEDVKKDNKSIRIQNNPQKLKPDSKNSYGKSLLSVLGTFFFLIDCANEGNGLLTFLIQKKLHKPIWATCHKNYAVSLLSYKHNVLAHPNAQFAHQYLWNTSAS